MERFWQFWGDSSGSGMTEYALLLAFVAIALVVSLEALSGSLQGVFTDAQSGLGGS